MNTRAIAFLILVLSMFLTLNVLAVEPFGASYTNVSSERAPADNASSRAALAGNVTEITITGFSTTQTWQGYFGNVSGTVQLADASDNVMYNWSLANPEGEVYATENSSVNWTGTACAVNSTDTPILESMYGITSSDVDGVDETFSYFNNHDEFYVNNIQIAADTCNLTTKVFGDSGAGVDQEFEEIILKAGSGEYVFAALLEEGSVTGFNNADHDFEMLVLEDGHGTDTDTTLYYFYVELE